MPVRGQQVLAGHSCCGYSDLFCFLFAVQDSILILYVGGEDFFIPALPDNGGKISLLATLPDSQPGRSYGMSTDTLATPGPTEARAERRNVIFIIRGSGMRGPLVWLTGVPRTGALLYMHKNRQ